MKTTVERATVEMIVDGHRSFYAYSIATRSGDLMTKRLKKLLDGSIISNYQRQHDHLYSDWPPDVQFVGAVWAPPYQLLREIAEDRKALQRELFQMEGLTDLTEYPTLDIPMKECSHKISELMETELKLRKKLKARIRELDRIKEERDAETEAPGAFCSAWELDGVDTDACTDADMTWQPDTTCAPKPYAW